MTTELEQEFFKVFGIEPYWQYKVHQFCHFYYCDKKTIIKNAYLFKERKTCKVKEAKRVYPEITDRKLLKLICKAYCLMFAIQGSSVELLKENILKEFLYWQKDVDKSEIQQIFKEEE